MIYILGFGIVVFYIVEISILGYFSVSLSERWLRKYSKKFHYIVYFLISVISSISHSALISVLKIKITTEDSQAIEVLGGNDLTHLFTGYEGFDIVISILEIAVAVYIGRILFIKMCREHIPSV